MAKRGLGRGLEALLPAKEEKTINAESIIKIAVNKIFAGKHQPRQEMDSQKLNELAQSIKTHGVIQPIVVKPAGGSNYEIVAGERRWRACQIAGLKEIPVLIKEIDAQQTAEMALIENLQREDLNQLEESEAYQKLIEQYKMSQEEIAKRVGKSRPAIANALRLLNLPEEIKDMLRNNEITTGHAKVILGLKDKDEQVELARLIKEKDLTVRQTEKAIKGIEDKTKEDDNKDREKPDAYLENRETEERLQKIFTTKVKLKQGKNNGRIEIYYYSPEERERIIAALLNR